MEVKQIYAIANEAIKQATGQEAVLTEDLSNVVDAGNALKSGVDGFERFTKIAPDLVGKQLFDSKPYLKGTLGLMVDSTTYGSIYAKYRARDPEASINESTELVDGHVYEQDMFYQPDVYTHFWNRGLTLEVDRSVSIKEAQSAFLSRQNLLNFFSMLEAKALNAIRKRLRELARRLITNQIAETVYQDYAGASISSKSGVKAVNLLYLYNTENGTSLSATNAIHTPEFLRFAAAKMGFYADAITESSVLFNNAAEDTWASSAKVILLSEFAKAIGPYSLSGAQNPEYLKLPAGETVMYWQGTGTDFSFSSTSKVDVATTAQGHSQTVTGVLGVMFDPEACVMADEDMRTTSHRNEKAEFTNYFHKLDVRLLADDACPFVVFFVA